MLRTGPNRTAMPLTTPTRPARPFLKWAGGKTQLLACLDAHFPPAIATGEIDQYVEPFVGGGAVFLHVAQTYPVARFLLGDANPELVAIYRVVRDASAELVDRLDRLQREYLQLAAAERAGYFYRQRDRLNRELPPICPETLARSGREGWLRGEGCERAALQLFLNRTCFNGLFRVNGKGEFNVPHGRYVKPRICDAENLRAVSDLLRRAEIYWGDYTTCADRITPQTFVYFDPPYRPISKTANFTAYSAQRFGDREQEHLSEYYRQLSQCGARLMLSNSDPKNLDLSDDFFERLYGDQRIERVRATRSINRDASKRGEIGELLILNYDETGELWGSRR